MEAVKTCKDCGKTKPREEFHRVSGKSLGCIDSRCKPCANRRREERRRKSAASHARQKEIKRARYRVKVGIPLDAPVWSLKNGSPVKPPRIKGPKRIPLTPDEKFERYLQVNFGIGVAEFRRMEASQGGVCNICRQPPRRKRLSVDHCHTSGKVRGLLCHVCNAALGLLKDDTNRLFTAIDYLRK